MTDHAEYCGPFDALNGKRAIVMPDESYHSPLENRTLLAQFDEDVVHPETKELMSHGWHRFPAAHFKLLVAV